MARDSWPLSLGPRVFQIGKLRSELEMVSGNVRVMSEMLTELVPTEAEPADLELLQVSKHTPQVQPPPAPGDFLLVCPHTFLPNPHCSSHGFL